MSNGNGKGIECPECGSKKKARVMSTFGMAFDDPRGTSKWDNFGYRAGFNMNKAQGERRDAQEASHMGATPYRPMDDANNFGEGITDLI